MTSISLLLHHRKRTGQCGIVLVIRAKMTAPVKKSIGRETLKKKQKKMCVKNRISFKKNRIKTNRSDISHSYRS